MYLLSSTKVKKLHFNINDLVLYYTIDLFLYFYI